MRVILDTNIWISGLLLPKSIAGNIIQAWQQAKYELVTSQPILDEIKQVLTYPKIQKRIRWNETKIEQYILLIKLLSNFVILPETDLVQADVRDLKDKPILATLVHSQGDYLVTGDQDLICLSHTYSIITLREFYQLIE